MPQVKQVKKAAEATKEAERAVRALRKPLRAKKVLRPPSTGIIEGLRNAEQAARSLREYATNVRDALWRKDPWKEAGRLKKDLDRSRMGKILVAGKPVYKNVAKYMRSLLDAAGRTKDKEKALQLVYEAREKMKRFADFVAAQRTMIAAGAPAQLTMAVGYSFRYVGTKEEHRSNAVLSLANLYSKNRMLFSGERMAVAGIVYAARYILNPKKKIVEKQSSGIYKAIESRTAGIRERAAYGIKTSLVLTREKLLTYRPRITSRALRKEFDLVLKDLDLLAKRAEKMDFSKLGKEAVEIYKRVGVLEELSRKRRPSRNRQGLYANALSAFREGKKTEFALQRLLTSEYIKVETGRYTKKLLDYSSKLRQGKVKAGEVLKFLAKHFLPPITYHAKKLPKTTVFHKALVLLTKRLRKTAKAPKPEDIEVVGAVREALTYARELGKILRGQKGERKKRLIEIYGRSVVLLLKGETLGAGFQRSLAEFFAGTTQKEETEILVAASRTFEKSAPSEQYMRTFYDLYRQISFLRISSRRGSVGSEGRKIAKEVLSSVLASLKALSAGKVDRKALERGGAEAALARECIRAARRFAPRRRMKGWRRRRRTRNRGMLVSIYGKAIAAVRKGKLDEAKIHLKLARAFQLSTKREDRKQMAKISSEMPANAPAIADAFYAKARAERVLRSRSRKAGRKERRILRRMRKNLSTYHDLAITALMQGNVADAPWIMRAARLYGNIALLSAEQREKVSDAISFIHKALGDHRKVSRRRRYIYLASADEVVRKRGPRNIMGDFPKALVASKTYAQYVGAKNAEQKLKDTYAKLNAFGKRVGRLLFDRSIRRLEKSKSAFEREKRRLDKRAAAAEKKGDMLEAERLRREATAVDFSRIQKNISGLRRLMENADSIAKKNPKRSAFLKGMAERGLAALNTLRESVVSVNTIERERGRRELVSAAEMYLKAATAKTPEAARRMLQQAETLLRSGNDEVSIQYGIRMRRDAGIRGARKILRRNRKNKKNARFGKYYKGKDAKKEARRAIRYYRRERFGIGAFALRRAGGYIATDLLDANIDWRHSVNEGLRKLVSRKHLRNYGALHRIFSPNIKFQVADIRKDIKRGRFRSAFRDMEELRGIIAYTDKRQKVAYMNAWVRGTIADLHTADIRIPSYFGVAEKPMSIEAAELNGRKRALVRFLKRTVGASRDGFISKELVPFLAKLQKKGLTERDVVGLVGEWTGNAAKGKIGLIGKLRQGERARQFAERETVEASIYLSVAQLYKRIRGRSNNDLLRVAAEKLQLGRAAVTFTDKNPKKDFFNSRVTMRAVSIRMTGTTKFDITAWAEGVPVPRRAVTARETRGVFGSIMRNQRAHEWRILTELMPLKTVGKAKDMFLSAGRLQKAVDTAMMGYEYDPVKRRLRRRKYTPEEMRRLSIIQGALGRMKTSILYTFPMAFVSAGVLTKAWGMATGQSAENARDRFSRSVMKKELSALKSLWSAYFCIGIKSFEKRFKPAMALANRRVDDLNKSTKRYVSRVRSWGEKAAFYDTIGAMAITMIPKVGWAFGAVYFGSQTYNSYKVQVRQAGGLKYMTKSQKRSLYFHTGVGFAFAFIPVGRYAAGTAFNRLLIRSAYRTVGKKLLFATIVGLGKTSHALAGVMFVNFAIEIPTMYRQYKKGEIGGYGVATAAVPQLMVGLSYVRTGVRGIRRLVSRTEMGWKPVVAGAVVGIGAAVGKSRSALKSRAPSAKQSMKARKARVTFRQRVRGWVDAWRARRLAKHLQKQKDVGTMHVREHMNGTTLKTEHMFRATGSFAKRLAKSRYKDLRKYLTLVRKGKGKSAKAQSLHKKIRKWLKKDELKGAVDSVKKGESTRKVSRNLSTHDVVYVNIDKSGLNDISNLTPDAREGHSPADAISKEYFKHILKTAVYYLRKKGYKGVDYLLGFGHSDERGITIIGRGLTEGTVKEAIQYAKDVASGKKGMPSIPKRYIKWVTKLRSRIRKIRLKRLELAEKKGKKFRPVTPEELGREIQSFAREHGLDAKKLERYYRIPDARTYIVEVGGKKIPLSEFGASALQHGKPRLIAFTADYAKTKIGPKTRNAQRKVLGLYHETEARANRFARGISRGLGVKEKPTMNSRSETMPLMEKGEAVQEDGTVFQVHFSLNENGRKIVGGAIFDRIGKFFSERKKLRNVEGVLKEKRPKDFKGGNVKWLMERLKVSKKRARYLLKNYKDAMKRGKAEWLMRELGINKQEARTLVDAYKKAAAPKGNRQIPIELISKNVFRKGSVFAFGDIGFSEGNTFLGHAAMNTLAQAAIDGARTRGARSLGNLAFFFKKSTMKGKTPEQIRAMILARVKRKMGGTRGIEVGVRAVHVEKGTKVGDVTGALLFSKATGMDIPPKTYDTMVFMNHLFKVGKQKNIIKILFGEEGAKKLSKLLGEQGKKKPMDFYKQLAEQGRRGDARIFLVYRLMKMMGKRRDWRRVRDLVLNLRKEAGKDPKSLRNQYFNAMISSFRLHALAEGSAIKQRFDAVATRRALPKMRVTKVLDTLAKEKPRAEKAAQARSSFLRLTASEQDLVLGGLKTRGKTAEASHLAEMLEVQRMGKRYSSKEFKSIYGLSPTEMVEIYKNAKSLPEARKMLAKRLGIQLVRLPEWWTKVAADKRSSELKGRVSPQYQHFSSLADDGYLFGMLTSGELLKAVKERYPNSRVYSIEFMNGVVGAYMLRLVDPKGRIRSVFVKRQDCRADKAGARYQRASGTIAPNVYTATKAGKPLRYTRPDGRSSRYGIIENIGEWEGTIRVGKHEIPLRNRSSQSARNLAKMDYEALGYYVASQVASGAVDFHRGNTYKATAQLVKPKGMSSKQFRALLKTIGYKKVRLPSGKEGLKQIKKTPLMTLEMDGKGRIVVKGRMARIDTDSGGGFRARSDGKGGYDLSPITRWMGGDLYTLFEAIVKNRNEQAESVAKRTRRYVISSPTNAAKYAAEGFQVRTRKVAGKVEYFIESAIPLEKKFRSKGLAVPGTIVLGVGKVRKITVLDVISEAFGTKGKEGKFLKGVRRWYEQNGKSRLWRKRMRELLARHEGTPTGIGHPMDRGRRATYESKGSTSYIGIAYNGERNLVARTPEGRPLMRARAYEVMGKFDLKQESMQKRFTALFPENTEVYVVPMRGAPPRGATSVMRISGNRYITVFGSKDAVPATHKRAAIPVRNVEGYIRAPVGFGRKTGLPMTKAGAIPVFDYIVGRGVKGMLEVARRIKDETAKRAKEAGEKPSSKKGLAEMVTGG